MFKKSILALSTLLFATNIFALECYPLANGENGQGSKHSVRLSPVSGAFSSDNKLDITIRNIGTRYINIKVRFFDENNQPVLADAVTYAANFSTSNNPITNITGGGLGFLPPERIGTVRAAFNSPITLTPEITWLADACEPFATTNLMVNVTHYYTEGGQSYKENVTVSGGNIFL